jgi:DNA-binding MarR family transcriptional regulator
MEYIFYICNINDINMNKTVELVQEWADFEAKNPEGNLEDFCRNFLAEKEKNKLMPFELTSSSDYQLIYSFTKVVNRLSKLWMYFTLNAIKPYGLTSFEEFAFLFSVNQAVSMRKKDLIYMNLIEISSGLLVIDRLVKKGFMEERTDEVDKRSKQVTLTEKGKDTLNVCQVALGEVAEELYGQMPKEDMKSCIQYIWTIEKSIAQKWHQIKRFEPV